MATLPHQRPEPLPREIRTTLAAISRRRLLLSLAECLAALAGGLAGLGLLQSLADWAFNLPWAVRLLLLMGDAGALGWLLYRLAWVPVRTRLDLRGAALLVERKIPTLRSSLISAVELTHARPGWPQGSPALVELLARRVAYRLKDKKIPRQIVPGTRARQWARWAALPLLLAGAAGTFAPEASGILARRLLLAHIQLPSRTRVFPITENLTVAVGSDVNLAASVQGVIPRHGRVLIVYANGSQETLAATSLADGPAQFGVTLKNLQQSFRYRFVLNDGEGFEYRVAVLPPPAVAACRFIQTYPGYTGLRAAEMSPGNLALMAGSRLQIEARSTLPLRSAAVQFEGGKTTVALAVSASEPRAFKGDFEVPREGLTGFSLLLVSAEGAPSVKNTLYHVDFVPDNPPKVELTAPEQAALLVRTKPALNFSAKDDFGLAKFTLCYELTRPAAPGAATPPAETGAVPLPVATPGTAGSWSFRWEPARELPRLVTGCTVRYWIEATDNNNVTGPGIGQSAKKTLVFVSEEEKKAKLLESLGAKAADLEGLQETQKKLNEDLDSTIRKSQ